MSRAAKAEANRQKLLNTPLMRYLLEAKKRDATKWSAIAKASGAPLASIAAGNPGALRLAAVAGWEIYGASCDPVEAMRLYLEELLPGLDAEGWWRVAKSVAAIQRRRASQREDP